MAFREARKDFLLLRALIKAEIVSNLNHVFFTEEILFTALCIRIFPTTDSATACSLLKRKKESSILSLPCLVMYVQGLGEWCLKLAGNASSSI